MTAEPRTQWVGLSLPQVTGSAMMRWQVVGSDKPRTVPSSADLLALTRVVVEHRIEDRLSGG